MNKGNSGLIHTNGRGQTLTLNNINAYNNSCYLLDCLEGTINIKSMTCNKFTIARGSVDKTNAEEKVDFTIKASNFEEHCYVAKKIKIITIHRYRNNHQGILLLLICIKS